MEVRELTKVFGKETVINGISFSQKPGEILAVLGPEGAGKTALLKILAGVIEPTSGQIFYRGRNIREDINEYKNQVGYAPEHPDIFPHLNAVEYLQLVGRMYLIPEPVLEEKISGFLEQFQLSEEMHLPVSTYSKGMIQKVSLSAAMIHNPDILLLDEPLAGLDMTSALIMRDLLQKLAGNGKLVICATRILEVAEQLCDRALIVNKGIIVSNNPVKELRNLMDLPLLESILKKMVQQHDIEESVHSMMSIIQS